MTILLVVVLTLPNVENPVIHIQKMDTMTECTSAVREMVGRAPYELRQGGKFSAGCQVEIAKSENP